MHRHRPDRSLLALTAAVFLTAPVVAAPGLDSILADYRSLDLGSTSVRANGQTVGIGHLTMTFESGVVHPLVSNEGRVLGFYFEGSGIYEYASEFPADRQVFESNFKALSKAPVYRDHKVRDSVERMLLFFARPAFEPLWDPGQAAVEERGPDPAARKGFESIWNRIAKTYLEYDHLAAVARLNGGNRQYVYAEIDGGRETLGYSYNTVRGSEERLFLFRKFGSYDLRFRQTVSSQPIGSDSVDLVSPVVLSHAGLDLSTEDNRTAEIVSDLTFDVLVDDLVVVPLALINNVDPYQYDWESERDALHVSGVTDGQGRELEFSHRYHEILIQLPEPASKGDSIRLHVESAGDVLTGMSGDRSDNYFELVFTEWFPTPLGWANGNSRFTLELRCRTRKPYRPIASGKVRSLEEEGDFYVLETSSEQPLKSIAVLAGKYEVAEETFDDLVIRVYAYAGGRKNVLKNMPKLAYTIVEYYEGLLGPYPFEELNIVEVPEYGFGIAPAGVVLMTSDAYNPHQDYLASFFSRGVNARLAHEIAHQWFFHRAMPAHPRDNWLSESFAEYMSGMVMAAAGKKARVMGIDRMLDEWWRDAISARDAGPISAASELSGPDASRERFQLLYSRGPLVLRMLHSTVGNERFFAILRRFLDNADMGYVTTADFAEACTQVMGFDMSWFVEDWVGRGGIPEIDVEWDVKKAEGGGLVLSGTAAVAEGHEHKRLIVPLVVDYGSGQQQVLPVDLDAPRKRFEFPLPAKPRGVKVDPQHNCLAKFE